MAHKNNAEHLSVNREILKDVLVWKDDKGKIVHQKGTRCTLIQNGSERLIEKEWVSGDWLFTADYQYSIEKSLYEKCGTLGLPVPKLIDSDDEKRVLHIEYIEGPKLKPPCKEIHHLLPILDFFDHYKKIQPESDLWPITGQQIHTYHFQRIQYSIPDESAHDQIDQIFTSFLDGVRLFTIPFDAILKNVIVSNRGLYFIDFEWTIGGPYELVLARLASEFNLYDHDLIMERVESLDLYHLFLLRFYMQDRWPETLFPYLRDTIKTSELREFFGLVNSRKYTNKPWCT
jgi:hypothetical protein